MRWYPQVIRKYYNQYATTQNLLAWPQAPVAVEGLRLALERVGYEYLTLEGVMRTEDSKPRD